jgi:hypothetical protein
MATIHEGGAFETFNDVMGNPLISINRDGTISTQGNNVGVQGVTFADNTKQTTAGGSAGPFAGDYYAYPPFEGNRSGGAFYPGSLNVAVMPVYLSRNIVLTNAKISINAPSTTPGVFYYFGIYDPVTKNLLSFAKFPIGVGAGTGIKSQPLQPQITVPQGMALFCQGSDDTTSAGSGNNYQFDTDLMNMFPGGGSSTTLIAGGALPFNLGAVTGAWPDSSPYIMLY